MTWHALRRCCGGVFAVALLLGVASAPAQATAVPHSFELLTHRMDVDVDGAPRAYGPPGSHALDRLRHARPKGNPFGHVVGYIVEDRPPHHPVVQGPQDPAPGFYVSQTALEDEQIENEHDPRRYVNASTINYVVLGAQARRMGARLGDLVAVYSRRTGRSVFGIVGDDGNRSGDEGSLHLLQALGYPFHDGKDDAIEDAEIVIRFYPGSNPQHLFFHTQAALDAAARDRGLSRDFAGQPAAPVTRP